MITLYVNQRDLPLFTSYFLLFIFFFCFLIYFYQTYLNLA